MRGANVYVVVLALSCASRVIHAFCPLPSIPHHGPHLSTRGPRPLRVLQGRAAKGLAGRARVTAVTLSGETLAVGAVVAGATAIAASRALSTLAGAFKLADYRTTSGHDLRLDEKLESKRRPLSASQEAMRQAPPAPSTGTGAAAVIDWREEIRLASQLPEDDDAAIDDLAVVRRK